MTSEALLKSRQTTSTALLIHQASHFIVEGSQVSSARLPLHKSLLTTPNHHLVPQSWKAFPNTFALLPFQGLR